MNVVAPPSASSDWMQTLQAGGARIAEGIVADFGDLQAELAATGSDATVLADLSHLSMLRFSGADATTFLQGQLSCDVAALPDGGVSPGAYCTPKGRILASFLLIRDGDAFGMLLSRSIAAAIRKRLTMYVLRSKVSITDSTDASSLIGVAGGDAAAALMRAEVALPDRDDHALASKGLWLRLSGRRYLGCVDAALAAELWRALTASAKPVGTPCWEWLDVRAGFPIVTLATQDQLVPQMANLDLIGGVSFKKGCYPGQEIVARTHHLGKIKRRMVLANVHAAPPPHAGDAIYGSDFGDQASGSVVNAAPSPLGGYDVLAVLQLSTAAAGTAHLRALNGPPLTLRALPYAVSEISESV